MKIQIPNTGPLTNFEVLDFLRSRGASKDPNRVMSSLAPSELKVFDYLIEGAAANQTRESINEFLEKSKEYQLSKTEIMSIINIVPYSEVELFPLIDDYEARMEPKAEEFLEMLAQVFPPPNESNPDDEAAMDEPEKATDGENEQDQTETS